MRDHDAELASLNAKATALKSRKAEQLGQVVFAIASDAIDTELLAGILLAALERSDDHEEEAWRAKGAAFFRRRPRKTGVRARSDEPRTAPGVQGDAAR